MSESWSSLCSKFSHDPTNSSISFSGKKLGNKWRNLRDSFVRAQKKKPLEGSRCDYMFGKNLSFLDVVYAEKHRPRDSSESDDSPEETVEPKIKKIKTERELAELKLRSPVNDCFLEYVGTPVEPLVHQALAPGEFDDDRLFFESLLPATRHLDIDQKLQFRTQVLNLISGIRKRGRTNPLDHQL